MEYELQNSPNTTVDAAKDHAESYMEVRPPLVCHRERNHVLPSCPYFNNERVFI